MWTKVLGKLNAFSLIPNPFNTHNLSQVQSDKILFDAIQKAQHEGTGLMIARLGAAEHDAIMSTLLYQTKIINNLNTPYQKLCNNAGFFPKHLTTKHDIYMYIKKFTDCYIQSMSNCDILGVWSGVLGFEKYLVNSFCQSNCLYTRMGYIAPSIHSPIPFTYALKDAKVLVIHPFAKSIEAQYQNRQKLFKNDRVLPCFTLRTLKAIQTAGDEVDDRFTNWFEALDWMSEEVSKIDFDIALLGCGAYGFPLASKIKNMGKIAIHFGGNLQLLFGIKGRRWEIEQPQIGKEFFNEYWIYPSQEEKIKNFSKIEGGCYW